MMRHEQHVGAELGVAGDQRRFLRLLDIPGQQHRRATFVMRSTHESALDLAACP